MKLYRKVKDIPGCSEELILETREIWTSFLDSMNLDFDYMVDSGWLIAEEIDIAKKVLELEKRIGILERLDSIPVMYK